MAGTLVRDMTEGSPTRRIVEFFFPLLFGLLFQQVYNMVDTIVVGKFLGVKALAGVGSTGSLSFLVLGFCIGVCNGFAIPVAQKFGERDYPGLKRFVVNAILLAVTFSLVITAVVCALCSPLLGWMNTPSDIVDDAYAYIFVIFLGIPVVFIYNVLFSIIRSLGDSRTPVIYLVICSLLNVVLDLLFIVSFGMGVEGAAWATVISQAVSSLLCVRYIRHCDLIVLTRRDWKLDKTCVKRLIGMGVPTGLQYSITAIGSIVLQASVNLLGSSYVASVAAGTKVSQLFCCTFDALGSTMATYGGQNIGAGKIERVKKGLAACSLLGAVYAVIGFLIILVLGRNISMLFVNDTNGGSVTEILDLAQQFLVCNGAFYIPLAFVNIVRFLIQGMGFSQIAIFAGVFEMIARGLVALALVPVFGFNAVCFANPAAWIFADCFLFPLFFWCYRKMKLQFQRHDEKQLSQETSV